MAVPLESGLGSRAVVKDTTERLAGHRFDTLYIQFAEAEAFAAGIKQVTDRVRRVVIGTHSRKIEDELIETFRAWSWFLEHETACKYRIDNGLPYLNTDGVQVWRNTRIAKS